MIVSNCIVVFFFSSRRRHTRSCLVSWGSEMCIRDRGHMGATRESLAAAREQLYAADRAAGMATDTQDKRAVSADQARQELEAHYTAKPRKGQEHLPPAQQAGAALAQ